jgi:hypothetical protein
LPGMAALVPCATGAARHAGVENHPARAWTASRWHGGFVRGVCGGGLRAPPSANARRGSEQRAHTRREVSTNASTSFAAHAVRRSKTIAPTPVALRTARCGSSIAGFAVSNSAARLGSRRVHCRAKRSKISDDVGFNYDDFDEFVGTDVGAGATSATKSSAKKNKDVSVKKPEAVNWSEREPPPDPKGGPLPDLLSWASPLLESNKHEDAKALRLQRAWVRISPRVPRSADCLLPLMDVLLYYLTVLVPVSMLLVQSQSPTTTIPFPIPDIHMVRPTDTFGVTPRRARRGKRLASSPIAKARCFAAYRGRRKPPR